MRWSDERYVRLYTRDTADWLTLSFTAKALFCLLLRKVDRAGLLPLGRQGKKAVAVCVGHGHDWATLGPALEELLADGCVAIDGNTLVVPNYLEAQEAAQSDAARKRAERERARVLVTVRDERVTQQDNGSHNGTGSHEMSQGVTPSLAKPSLAKPETHLVVNADDAGAFGKVAEVWNRVCVPAGFARPHSTAQQRKAARTRMRDASWLVAFEAACEYVAREPFYRGGSSSGWTATLGWLLKAGNAEKTAEQAATRRASPKRVTDPAQPHEAWGDVTREIKL